ncbi:MAG: hypothetical protein KKF58_00840 [Gammaproteobacteria bacterium]|nr:hypothetical protein [Gammaproteobacteria bacterium]MBU1446834.1 hypothetical protein [Gammaproteobacteria bacterium]
MMPSVHLPTSDCKHQHGGALLVMLVILVMGVSTAFLASLGSTSIDNQRNTKTADALAQAKAALIGYAVTYGDTHPAGTNGTVETDGYLPCPDMDGSAGANAEGSSETCGTAGANTLGRLPWRTLDLPALFDGSQDCLWYAVSGNYKNNPKSGATMNWDTPGQLKVYDSNGNEIAPGEIVALVIAPGAVINGNNDRAGTAAPTCGGNYDSAAYLENDTVHGHNNADGIAGEFILPHAHRDANGNITLTVNDQFILITRQDIWAPIQKRVAREAKRCLDNYAASNSNRYPWAVPIATSTVFSPFIMGSRYTRFGRLPTQPNVQTQSTPSDIVDMQAKFATLWTTLATFAADKTWSNRHDMRDAALSAYYIADHIKDTYDGNPLEDPARQLRNAAGDAYNLSIYSSSSTISAVQKQLLDSAYAFVDAMSSQFTQASGMSDNWPASCTFFTSARWDHWRDLILYQLASGYQPISSASCGSSCLSIQGSGHAQAGSGSYRATIAVAGKKLTANRNTISVVDYLEPVNQLPPNDVSKPYMTYRVTDSEFQTVNDLVLCLDGQVNCQ